LITLKKCKTFGTVWLLLTTVLSICWRIGRNYIRLVKPLYWKKRQWQS